LISFLFIKRRAKPPLKTYRLGGILTDPKRKLNDKIPFTLGKRKTYPLYGKSVSFHSIYNFTHCLAIKIFGQKS